MSILISRRWILIKNGRFFLDLCIRTDKCVFSVNLLTFVVKKRK